jgi:uncharacterized membrane protein YvbJ
MAVCPQCGANVSQEAVICQSCNAVIASSANVTAASDDQTAQLNARLKKALRRTEVLSYAAAGLGLAILAVIIIISFLPRW